jgi:transcriptional regulator with XRE-family HTH domain
MDTSSFLERRLLFQARDLRGLRKCMRLTQARFWQVLGIAQPTGSRYEAGARVPAPVLDLLRLLHVEGIDIRQLRREEVPQHRVCRR